MGRFRCQADPALNTRDILIRKPKLIDSIAAEVHRHKQRARRGQSARTGAVLTAGVDEDRSPSALSHACREVYSHPVRAEVCCTIPLQ